MEKKPFAKLEVNEWYWECPVCETYNFVRNDDLWDGDSEKDQKCETCNIVVEVDTHP